MNILESIDNLIIEVAAQQPPAPPPQGEGEAPPAAAAPPEAPPAPQVKAPKQITSFVKKMVKDFGPDGNKSMDMNYMRKAREALGITGGAVSKTIDMIQNGATPEDVEISIKKNTRKF
jgi:hypothetical protein